MELIFATNNEHKIDEIKAVLPKDFTLLTLNQAGINIDIPEPHDTLEDNAAEKARAIYQVTGKACFGEDTGLEVEALNGAPGVHSARYAGEERKDDKNIEKLLQTLQNEDNRSAQFRTVICLVLNDQEYFMEGICKGIITTETKGSAGFGYDAVFKPDGTDKTFAQMNRQEKNQYSHRGIAADKLVVFLNRTRISLKN